MAEKEPLMVILSDDFFMFTLGCLECNNKYLDDREFYEKGIKHREFFKNSVHFNPTVDLKDKNI